jgi:hypothetical protein
MNHNQFQSNKQLHSNGSVGSTVPEFLNGVETNHSTPCRSEHSISIVSTEVSVSRDEPEVPEEICSERGEPPHYKGLSIQRCQTEEVRFPYDAHSIYPN